MYTVSDIVRLTGMAPRKIRKMLKRKTAEGTRAGSQRLFSEREIQAAFCNKNTILQTADGNSGEIRDFINGNGGVSEGNLRVCVIADMFAVSREEARLAAARVSEIIETGGFEKDCGRQSFSYEYSENEKKARFTLIGGYFFVVEALKGFKQSSD